MHPRYIRLWRYAGTPDGGDDVAFRQVAENVEHGGSAAAGEKIGTVVPAVAQQVYQGQPGKKPDLRMGPASLCQDRQGIGDAAELALPALSAPIELVVHLAVPEEQYPARMTGSLYEWVTIRMV